MKVILNIILTATEVIWSLYCVLIVFFVLSASLIIIRLLTLFSPQGEEILYFLIASIIRTIEKEYYKKHPKQDKP